MPGSATTSSLATQAGFQPWNGNWNGHLSEFAPNGRALSPMTSGFTGGGVFGPGFGTAVAADGKVWVSNNVPGPEHFGVRQER